MLHLTFVSCRRGRKYKRKTTMASCSDRQLRDAIAAAKGGRSMKGTVKDYGIPKRTLTRHCQGKVAQPGVSVLGGKRQVFTDELENETMTTIQRMEREMYGLSTNYVRRLANRGWAITHPDVMPIFRQAYVNSATMQASVNGFAVSGICPRRTRRRYPTCRPRRTRRRYPACRP